MDDLLGAEWVGWRNHPKTQEFVRLLKLAVQDASENWIGGKFLNEDSHTTLVNTLFAQASAKEQSHIIDIIENIKMEPEKEQQNGQ